MKKFCIAGALAALLLAAPAAADVIVPGAACTPPANNMITTQGSTNSQVGVVQCVPNSAGAFYWQAVGNGIVSYDTTATCSIAGQLRWNGAGVQFCDGGSWKDFGGNVPSGTICGFQTNDANFGGRCQGYSPYLGQCPAGYFVAIWRVNFGNGWLMFCVKE